MRVINVGIAGLGTVGLGTYQVLQKNAQELTRRTGCQFEVKTVLCRHLEKAKKVVDASVKVTDDWKVLVEDPSIDVLVEVIGGIEPAKSIILGAIANKKHVVTANKALLAHHGNEIFQEAQKQEVGVFFEAAVAGGVPVIKALREGLAANKIDWIAGIINGTSNYILSSMRETGATFEKALSEAQALGYAEADPTFDVDGQDAAHKLTVLSSLAFGVPLNFEACHIEGIRHLEGRDIGYAEDFGYRIKLLGITKHTKAGIERRVHPTLVPTRRLLANVEGVQNAVVIKGDAVGPTLLYGQGAGAQPTASAVIADLVDIARMIEAGQTGQRSPLGFINFETNQAASLPMSETQTAFYLRLRLEDRSGVLAEVMGIFAQYNISIEAMIQREAIAGSNDVDVVVMTHIVREGDMQSALTEIEKLECTKNSIVRIRKEDLN